MQAKKLYSLLLILALTLGMSACNNKNNQSSILENPGTELGADPDPNPAEDEAREILPAVYDYKDEHVQIDVEFDRGTYTLTDFINIKVIVTNAGNEPIYYEQGSSSNPTPSALDIRLDEFAAHFYPVIATSDYGIHSIEPGENAVFECPFAPYVAVDENVVIGTGNDIAYFQTEDFIPAKAGIYEGTLTFTYALSEQAYFDGTDKITITGEFSAEIVEAAAQGDATAVLE